MTESESADLKTVEDRMLEQLEYDELHALALSHVSEQEDGDVCYLLVARSTTWEQLDGMEDIDIPVVDIRTVVVDLRNETVKISDNGIWVPRDSDVLSVLTGMTDRCRSEIDESRTEQGSGVPTALSAVDGVDLGLLLERPLESERGQQQDTDMMDRHPGIDPEREWGYGAGPPPELDRLIEHLEDVGLEPSDHLTRLVWGKKEPMTRDPRPADELLGNYGLELLPRDSGLVALDVDYPDEFPDVELPETLEISSPHGDDDQRHILLWCDDKDELANEFGAYALQGIDWGDLWIGDRYLCGPGSQLSEFGCDDGDHERGEPGGCARCSDPDGGYYEIINDSGIAGVDPETIIELVESSSGYEQRDEETAPDPPDDEESSSSKFECANCGVPIESDADGKIVTIAGETQLICAGGCD